MMVKKYIYIDTTQKLSLALIGEDFSILSHKNYEENKTANIIHTELNLLMEENKLNADSDISLIINNGPGSYTGVRVGEGIGKVFEMDGKKIFSFNEHEIFPLLVKKGLWVSNAFKGEFFVCAWSDQEALTNKLVDRETLTSMLENYDQIYTNDLFDLCEIKMISSKETLIKNASRVFQYIVSNELRLPPFYFRKIDQEFKIKK
ncbi:MAG: hypothetical protein CME61_03845 [Halobacteriovoraceae bacterium]|nr:hypothetical protein [Halobacteriovoraceae bacterium]|tara:strand:- start:687 stop:1298 length:612 start_codon:yes stop_codon:yes gene_type:complete